MDYYVITASFTQPSWYNKPMEKKILTSGIRATGTAHLGNYLGAIKQFLELQDQYSCNFFIADLHALTTPFVPSEVRQKTLEVAADYLALGLDPEKANLFVQSQVPEHAELAWIFNCITPLGELYRMTQFKEKSEQTKDSSTIGLLDYPVLMAADILLYKTMVVPVGEDQVQHLELSRIIARKFNRIEKVFPEPKALVNKTARVKSIINPEKKMSKSNDTPIYISDSPEIIQTKLKKAVTGSDTSGKSAGATNLMDLLKEFGTADTHANFQKEIRNGTIQYSALKEALADSISTYFADFRVRRQELLDEPEIIARALSDGAERAREMAHDTIVEVKKAVGLI
jgi:tryptophanyl-tRNA synthetase